MVSKFYYKTNKSELLDYVKKGIYHPEATYELLRYIEDYHKVQTHYMSPLPT